MITVEARRWYVRNARGAGPDDPDRIHGFSYLFEGLTALPPIGSVLIAGDITHHVVGLAWEELRVDGLRTGRWITSVQFEVDGTPGDFLEQCAYLRSLGWKDIEKETL